MMKFSVVCLYFVVIAVHFWDVKCMTKDQEKEIIKVMKPLAEECVSSCSLNDDDMKKYKEDGVMDPCFKKCILQKLGLLDEDGKYNQDALHESVSQFADDKDKAQKFEDQINECFEVNGDNNGDDEESQMKRVDVIFKCIEEAKE